MIVLHRRIEGLTVEAVPTFGDARRAARAFPKPAPGLHAWQVLASSGHVLGAFEQEGLVPEAWLTRSSDLPATVTRSGHTDRAAVNGDMA